MSNEYKDWIDNCIIDYATKKHSGQIRKYTNEPYINHPVNVANIIVNICLKLQEEGFGFINSDVIRNLKNTAILHDVVEDTDATFLEIEKKFGIHLRNMIFWLTNISKPEMGNRAYRKKIDLYHNMQAPIPALIVKLADVIDNCSDLVQRDKEFAKKYLKEKNTFLRAIYKKYKDKLNNDKSDYGLIFTKIYNKAYKVINNQIKELNNEN